MITKMYKLDANFFGNERWCIKTKVQKLRTYQMQINLIYKVNIYSGGKSK